MEPLDYLRALRRRWVILLAAALVGGAAGWLTAPAGASSSSSSLRLPGGSYKATQNLMVERQESGKRSKGADTTNLPLLAVLATSGEVPLRVAERLGLQTTAGAIAGRVEVEADEKLETLRISSTGSNPAETAAIVDAFAEEILRLAGERNEALRSEALTRAKATADAQQVRIRHLDARLLQLPPGGSEARLITAEREALLKVYAEQQGVLQELQSQPAASPGLVSLGPAVPIPTGGSGEMSGGKALQVVGDRRARAGLGILLGFVLGCALALLVDQIDTRVRSRREAEKAFGLPVVAEIPRTRPLSPRAKEHGGTFGVDPATADAFGRLGLAVLHSPRWVLSPRSPTIANDDEEDWPAPVRLVEGPTRLVLVASPGREDARAAVIANLAASLAAAGRSVIAIDCDPERRRLAELLGVHAAQPGPAHPGHARPGEPTGEAATGRLGVRPSAVRGVWVVTPGTSRGAGHADGQLMRSYLEWGDVVLVDAGPILSGGEAGSWAVEADAVLIVTGVGRTTADTAALAHDHLARLQARVLGVALVDGVARIARSRPPSAPSPPATPPRVSPAGTPAGAPSMPSGPLQDSRVDGPKVRAGGPDRVNGPKVRAGGPDQVDGPKVRAGGPDRVDGPKARAGGPDRVNGPKARAGGPDGGQPGPSRTTVRGEPSGEASTQRLLEGESVVRADARRNSGAHATPPWPVSSRPDPSERIRPVIEVLAPEPSAPAPSPQPRRRPHVEPSASHEPVWSVSRPWPWAAGDQREDQKSERATSTPEAPKTSVESPTEG